MLVARRVGHAAGMRCRHFSAVPGTPPPLCTLLDEESALAAAAWRFAQDRVAPLVRRMDHEGVMDPGLIRALFEEGLMGIEIPEAHGGCGASFTSACLVIEELAKVDPAVSVMVDIHNTIINNCFSNWASDELKAEWLPRLASDTLGMFTPRC